MMNEFYDTTIEMMRLLEKWEPILNSLPDDTIKNKRNSQNRTIKQITGHLIDSASNNTHRFVHLQYQPSPLVYPDYANFGNNDKWIAIQNYQEADWSNIVQLWKYSNLHIIHIINNLDSDKLGNEWISALNMRVSLKDMVIDYLRHFKLHLSEINELINKK